jgi:crotonobetainyl-CoA:carnitine CoA-transferase CaiB-like acyl-CoA transferase
MGGLMSLTGQPDSEPGGGPVKVGVAFADIFTGMYAANAVMAALFARQQSGKGTHIDLALLDVQIAVLANQSMNYLCSGQVPTRLGNAHPNIVPYQTFATRDGHLILAVGNDAQFGRFCDTAGCCELATDPRFASNQARVTHRDILIPLLQACIAKRSSADWLGALEAAGVPCGPINNLQQVFDDPQVKHRGLRFELPHATAGQVPMVGNPIRFDGLPLNAATAPPTLGQQTDQLLQQQLGLSPAECLRLREQGLIA